LQYITCRQQQRRLALDAAAAVALAEAHYQLSEETCNTRAQTPEN